MTAMMDAVHPSLYIKEELEAREWSLADLARRLPGDYGVNYVALDFYLSIGPETPTAHMGALAPDISRAFGADTDFFPNLERAWLDHPTTKALALKELH